jgi:perosamine synthetase
MKVPLALPEITEQDIAAVTDVLRSSRLSQGTAMYAFEEALANYVGVAHAVTLNSGTTALQLALRALGVQSGDEVIVPSFSFMAVTNALLNEKAVPVFVDIEENTFNIDPAALDAALSAKTKAIIVVHTFGYPARTKEILEFGRRHGLYVIEDACEALGAERNGHKAGALGHVGIFAFYPNKQITTGEGGALVTNSAEIAGKVRRLRNQGRQVSNEWLQNIEAGSSYRLSDINCALGLQQLSRIEQIITLRQTLALSYARHLEASGNLTWPQSLIADGRVSWFTYPVLLAKEFGQSERDEIWKRLGDFGIECGRYFPPAHLQPVMQRFPFRCGNLRHTISVAHRILCLPFFHSLADEQMEYVCASLQEELSKTGHPSPPRTKASDGRFQLVEQVSHES